jgi:hypothetical protein
LPSILPAIRGDIPKPPSARRLVREPSSPVAVRLPYLRGTRRALALEGVPPSRPPSSLGCGRLVGAEVVPDVEAESVPPAEVVEQFERLASTVTGQQGECSQRGERFTDLQVAGLKDEPGVPP